MDQSGSSNSSKVTVEYSDPSGIFPLVSNDLHKSLPLRNLHWNSSTRPLRFIDSLHVELINDDQRTSQSIPFTEDIIHTRANGTKERRHQIPGLRRTPYLKIYLLLCDDTETYKTTSRKLLREWVKDHTPPSQSSSSTNKAENHDAFEWLIIHVVLPAGDAAKASRFSGSSKGDSHAEKSTSASRWPNRNSSTVTEKVRSDFNGTSKAAVDRVAQIQIEDDQDESLSSDQHEQEDTRGFKDLVTKLKFLILASFDQRVSQYEEDIREKDSQRSLPGWNFNTFFLLKEGLARGFESVGLVEDALTSYHELSTTLNDIVATMHSKTIGNHTNPFREFTEDLLNVFKWAASELTDDADSQNTFRELEDVGGSILDSDRKPYRELILENNISAFDFLCYVFMRKVSLQLRIANVKSPNQPNKGTFAENEHYNGTTHSTAKRPKSKPEEPEVENLLVLAVVCQQALEFITAATRTIRKDLNCSTQNFSRYLETYEVSKSVRHEIIENIVASWMYSTAKVILQKTSVQTLSVQMQPLVRRYKSYNNSKEKKSHENAANTIEPAQQKNLSKRTSSLPSHQSALVSPSSSENFPSVASLSAMQPLPPDLSQTGFQYLAAQQADLYNLARRSLGSLGFRHADWKGSWSELTSTRSTEDTMYDLPLEDNETNVSWDFLKAPNKLQNITFLGIQNKTLRSALVSENNFFAAYEDLTALILTLFVLGDRPKSTEAMTADIAAIRFHLTDYAAAASYFHQLAPFYAKESWSHLEMSMLDMYAQCLKHLDRCNDYIRIGLKILAKLARENVTMSMNPWTQRTISFSLTDLISASTSLSQPVSVSMDSCFGSIVLDPYPLPCEAQDGFRLQIQIHNLMQEVLEAQHIKINLVSAEGDHRSELCLATNVTSSLKPGVSKIFLQTNIMIPGWYALDKILIRTGNIVFTREFEASRGSAFLKGLEDRTSSHFDGEINHFRVLVWPQVKTLDVRMSLYNTIHLEHPRSLLVEISTGWNNIIQGKVLLRAGSAGLRLHTADAVLASNNTTLLDQSQPGDIVFGSISADANLVLRVPYGLESDLKEITVRIEVSFTTAKGEFMYCCNPTFPVLLPLGVNVQDSFQEDSLFSKFTISTASAVPLRVLNCHLQSSADYDVISPPLRNGDFDVFARQPLSFISTVCRKPWSKNVERLSQAVQQRLLLQIEYRCLDQEISETIERSLWKSLAFANLLEISRLLIPNVLAKFRSILSIQDLETIGLLREIDVSIIIDSIWATIASGVRPACRDKTTKWLKDCHKEHTRLLISGDLSTDSKPQYLTVPVDVPQIGAVHTVSMKLGGNASLQTEIGAIGIGQPMSAELVIKHTRRWFGQPQTQTENQNLYFCYEVQANPDTWLIGGQKKAHFVAKEDETLRFPLVLLPQRVGRLLYPSVDISKLSEISDLARERKGSSKVPYVSETDYRNQGDTVLVVSNLSSTTVSLDPGNSISGAWLVESKSRPGT